ncbi:ZPR1 zinc finger domain-containing protein [Candidatus Woesearchaeota archaeon]|nr:ZPR1 zinc finger domain-containing protein [Candidatus Woesearchaeota archaeon]
MAEEAELKNETCPVCHKKSLVLGEHQTEVPYFGKVLLFSMTCSECKYHQSDVEGIQPHDPVKYTLEISSEEDMKIRVVKSSQATIKIPHIITITPGPASNGFVTNVEGILNRIKYSVETARDQEEDDETKKKAKNLLKKLLKVTWGQEKIKMIIEDPSGNSAIISEKAVKEKLKA